MATANYYSAVQKAYIAFYGRPADKVGLEYWAGQLNTANGNLSTIINAFGTSTEALALFGSQTQLQAVNLVYQQIFGRSADQAGLVYYGAELAAGRMTLVDIAQRIADGATGSDATILANKLTVAQSFTDAMDTADEILNYSGTAAATSARTFLSGVTADTATVTTATAAIPTTLTSIVTVGSATAIAGSTFTLTTGVDALTGTTGNDTFAATYDGTTAGFLGSADTVNGGDGTADVMNITASDDAAITLPAATVSNVETINVRNIDGNSAAEVLTVSGANFTGHTALNSDRSTDSVTFTSVASGASVGVIGNASVANGATVATYATAATAPVVNYMNGTTGTGVVTITAAGATSLTINSTGATNTSGALSTGSTPTATTINATAALEVASLAVGTGTSQYLTISGAAGDRAASSTSAAKSAVTLGALDADFASINASGLTAGGVSATLSATTAATFTGGAGSDRVTTSTSAQTGAVNAGSGTDTLILANSVDIDSAAEGAIYTGFEIFQANNGAALDMDLLTGSTITSIQINDAAGTTAVTDMSATQAAAVTVLAGAGAMTLGIKSATTVGTANTLNITVSDGDTTGSEAIWGTGDLTLAGVETVNITATDDLTWSTMANITGLTNLTVAGASDVSITTLVHAVTANESINFSGLTAASTFNFAGATTNALAFTGGSGIDTVTDSVIGGNVISTGAGRDVVNLTAKTGGTAASIITLGAGGDSLVTTAAKGNDAQDLLTLVYAAGDSVSDSATATTGFLAAKMDAITGIDLASTAAATAGHVITFDTPETATAVTFSATGITFGTTAVTNAYDFYVYNTGAGGITYAYQDTDGDKLIESGEWAVQLTGVAATATTTGEFTVSSGNLVLTTVA